MRLLEILILATLTPALVGSFFPGSVKPRRSVFLIGPVLLLSVLHLLVEGGRSHMALAYLLTVLLAVLGVLRLKRASPAGEIPSCSHYKRLAIAATILGLLSLAVTAALLAAFPVFRLPEPTGPYAVGTARLHLVDDTRPEAFTPDPDDRRELLVQVWYPAEVPAGVEPAVYWEDAPLLLDHLALVQTHSYPEAPLAGADVPFPVLVFSHGYFLSFVSQNTVQMEELASHGYVVFSIAHPYEALSVTYPDGRRVLFGEERLWAALDALAGKAARGLLSDKMDESLYVWTVDTIFVLDELERMNAGERESMFAGRLDLQRLGVFGMSFGGATAAQVCLVDSRCRAGINLDGALWGDDMREGGVVERPFMVMYDESTVGMNDEMYRRVESAAYRVTVRGSQHANFADFSLMSPLLGRVGWMRSAAMLGSIDGLRMERILSDYILAFFGKHLRGEEAPLLDGPSPDYPEVDFQSRNN